MTAIRLAILLALPALAGFSELALAQQTICPDGQRSYFGKCPAGTLQPSRPQVPLQNCNTSRAPGGGPAPDCPPVAPPPAPAAGRPAFRSVGGEVISEGWTGGAILTFSFENQGTEAWVAVRATGVSGPCALAHITGGLPTINDQDLVPLRTDPSRAEMLAFLPAGGRATASMGFMEAYCWSKLKTMSRVSASLLLVAVQGGKVFTLPLTVDGIVVRGGQ